MNRTKSERLSSSSEAVAEALSELQLFSQLAKEHANSDDEEVDDDEEDEEGAAWHDRDQFHERDEIELAAEAEPRRRRHLPNEDAEVNFSATASMSASSVDDFPLSRLVWGEEEEEDAGSLYHPSESLSSRSSFTPMSSRTQSRAETIDEEEVAALMDEDLDADIPVNYYNAILLNENMQKSLRDMLDLIDECLAESDVRHTKIISKLNGLQRSSDKIDKGGKKCLSRSLGVFAPPYFKDLEGYSHPPNPDTLKKRASESEVDANLCPAHEWSPAEKRQLKNAVREDAVRKRTKGVRARTEELKQKGFNAPSQEERALIFDELKALNGEIEQAVAMSDEDLFSNREEEFDWMRISVDLQKKFPHSNMSATSCKLMWQNLVHPSVNTSAWTKEEDERLKALVQEVGGRHWDAIADELGGGRTGFLCFKRYQSKHNKDYNRRRWTADEDSRLIQVVKKCRIHQFIPWAKVSYYMEGRTKEQCYQRYMCSLRSDLRKGSFKEEEDFMIMVGVKIFGECSWSKIADFVPHRTAVQLHSRYNTFIKVDFDSWTDEDDAKLLRLIKTCGNDWVRIAQEMKTKTRTQCRTRFHSIYKHYKRTQDNFDIKKVTNSSLQKIRQDKLKEKLNSALSEFLNRQKEERQQEVDGRFQTTDPRGYRMTPEGLSIPVQDLVAFMNEMKSKLINMTNEGTAGSNGPNTSNSSSWRPMPMVSGARLGIYEARGQEVKVLPSGRTQTKLKVKRGRPSSLPTVTEAKVNMELQNIFRSSWPARCGRRRAGNETAGRIEQEATCMFNVGKILECDQLDLTKVWACEDLDAKEKDVLAAFKEKVRLGARGTPIPSSVSAETPPTALSREVPASPSAVLRPPGSSIRTYSRKRKLPHSAAAATSSQPTTTSSQAPGTSSQATTTSSEPTSTSRSGDSGDPATATLGFVPPCRATLVGLRGLLLHLRRLRQLARDEDSSLRGPQTENVLMEGIMHGFVLNRAPRETADEEQPRDEESGESAATQADEKLYRRLKALFFWPAVMSFIQPPSVKSELFEPDELDGGPMAAATPFDATDIIQAAQNLSPARRVRVVKREARSSAAPSTAATGPSSPPDAIELSPPQPPKKRLLASVKESS